MPASIHLSPGLRKQIIEGSNNGQSRHMEEDPENQEAFQSKARLSAFVDRTPTPRLLPTLTALLHKETTPPWLRSEVSRCLALLPLRPEGVRQVIDFLASQSPSAPVGPNESGDTSRGDQDAHPQGPPLPLEVLFQASDLLASVPSSLDAANYYSLVGPQLFDLLDGQAGPELLKAAGFVIANGILARRARGAPGTAGWNVFAAPLLMSIEPNLQSEAALPSGIHSTGARSDGVLVHQKELQPAIRRLNILITSHPNPPLTLRLLRPLLLPLWALWNVTSKTDRKDLAEPIISLLQTYLKISPGAKDIVRIAENLLYDGETSDGKVDGYVYVSVTRGGIETRSRKNWRAPAFHIVARLEEIDDRVDRLMELLRISGDDDDRVNPLLLACLRSWLARSKSEPNKQQSHSLLADGATRDDSLQTLANVKLVQKLLEVYKDKLGGGSKQILELVKEVLDEFVEQHKVERRREQDMQKPTLVGLGNIVQKGDLDTQTPSASDGKSTAASTELATIALSLLSTVLSSVDLNVPKQDERVLESIKPLLSYLASARDLEISFTATASNLSSLIDFLSSSPMPLTDGAPQPSGALIEDRKTHSLALSYLADTIPPVRAQGLKLLVDLINASSPLIDVQATSTLLISLLQDDDEFIHLNAIKALAALANKHSRTVTKLLLEQYRDRDERMTLDQRLRLGEALLRTVQRLGEAFVEGTARAVGEGVLEIAGRRGQRPSALQEKAKRLSRDRARKQEAEDAWGGEVPQLDEAGDEDAKNEILARIVEGWEGHNGEEDVRIRASALAIFGAAIRVNVAGLGSSLTSTGVDLAMSVLSLETADEKAILRRAAVLVILDLVHALNAARDRGKKLSFGFAGENLHDVIRILQYVQGTDTDGLVREHAATVADELEAWRVSSMLGLPPASEESTLSSAIGPNDIRLAGLSVQPEAPASTRTKIEELE